VFRGVIHGTQRGEFNGIPRAGKATSVPAMQVHRMRDGKIAEAWLQVDRVGLLQQLGVIPAPGRGG
jgi:predicted ester cyclase